MSLRYGILGLLKFGPKTGYDVNAYFQHSLSFFWKAQTSQIYRELNKLEETEFASSEIVVQYDKPNRKVYHITDKGNEAFIQWLDSYEEGDELRDSFLLKMFFSGFRDKKKSIAALKHYIETAEKELALVEEESSEIQTTIPKNNTHRRYWISTSQYAIMHCKMKIEWAENTIKSLM